MTNLQKAKQILDTMSFTGWKTMKQTEGDLLVSALVLNFYGVLVGGKRIPCSFYIDGRMGVCATEKEKAQEVKKMEKGLRDGFMCCLFEKGRDKLYYNQGKKEYYFADIEPKGWNNN